ncbi:Winged helix-turn-helix DNA-binding [Halopenitus malekzadehii]|uniref:Winged helix-turn-helix DNA-binding n=1 Tax=Halopenitus malekzadehii TaxID=1267564 RepID=A0A1H6IER1_9EURY|nr:winged helix-turn-helix domain-containing protein [Halopenitus malekzadehii]SEH46889.1 Winged helix-turn-helix DNA-binding [Halopenitus malekzadehii]
MTPNDDTSPADDGTDSTDDDAVQTDEETDTAPGERTREEIRKTREKLGEGADKAVQEFDEGIVDLLSWVLDTETRARIYVYLREHPRSTSDEIADGTGLYPSTVREAVAELHEEETVTREKRESDGAGNNPYEYEAIAPSDLVRGVAGQVQSELNTVFNLDRRLGGDSSDDRSEPVRISVESGDDGETGAEAEGDDEAADDVDDDTTATGDTDGT